MTDKEMFIEAIANYVSKWNKAPGADFKKDLSDHLTGLLKDDALDNRFYSFAEYYFGKRSLFPVYETFTDLWDLYKPVYKKTEGLNNID